MHVLIQLFRQTWKKLMMFPHTMSIRCLTFGSCWQRAHRAPDASRTFLPLPNHERNSLFLPHSISVSVLFLLSVSAGSAADLLITKRKHSCLYQFIKEVHRSYLTLLYPVCCSYFLFLRAVRSPRSRRIAYILASTSSLKKFMILTSLYFNRCVVLTFCFCVRHCRSSPDGVHASWLQPDLQKNSSFVPRSFRCNRSSYLDSF